MTHSRARVCIVTPDYLCSTPRVVKEADALHAAGYDVRVVFAQGRLRAHRERDAELLSIRQWKATIVATDAGRLNKLHKAVRQRAAQQVTSLLWRASRLAEVAEGPHYQELCRAASRERADLFVGHYPIGLAVAAYAAQKWSARLGFDAEDLHSDEGSPKDQQTRIRFIEGRFFPRCCYITASSAGIASALSKRYGVARPTVVHNVFPLADRAKIDHLSKDRRDDSVSLYWYSQTIGLDRGIQDVLRAAGTIRAPLQIHLRGSVSETIKRALHSEANAAGCGGRLHFHEQVSPEELLSRTMEHDIGLALEQGHPENRALCATNKLFFYMVAGLAVLASDVPGQRTIVEETPGAARLYSPGDYAALATHIEGLLEDSALKRAKNLALQAAERRWNWERESSVLIAVVEQALAQPTETGVGEPLQKRSGLLRPGAFGAAER